MFIQQDWLMRQIEMLISTIVQLFAAETSQDSTLPEEHQQTNSTKLAQKLTGLLREGQLGKAEDLLFEHLDTEDKNILITAMDFYRQANAMSDAELENQDFTREELLEGLSEVAGRYGLYLPGFWDSPSES